MISKKQRIQFMQDTKEFILLCGGVEINGRFKEHSTFELTGKNGKCTLTMHGLEDFREIYSIYGRFSYLNDLTGRANHKYNFHSLEQDQENYIGRIIDELER